MRGEPSFNNPSDSVSCCLFENRISSTSETSPYLAVLVHICLVPLNPFFLSGILLLSMCERAWETDIYCLLPTTSFSAQFLLPHSHLSHLLCLLNSWHAMSDFLEHFLHILLSLHWPTASPPGLCLVSSYQPWCLVCPRRLLSSGCRFRGWSSSDSYLVIGASQPRLMKAVEHLGEARHGREITQTIRPYSTGKETLFYPCSNLKIYVSILKFDKSHTKSLIPGFLQKSEALAVWTQSLW